MSYFTRNYVLTPRDHRYGASVSRGVPVYSIVYSPTFATILIASAYGGMGRLS